MEGKPLSADASSYGEPIRLPRSLLDQMLHEATSEQQQRAAVNSDGAEPFPSEHITPISRYRGSREISMKKLILAGAAFCAFAFVPIVSVQAMPVTPLSGLTQIDGDTILVKGGRGRGHMGRGNRGRHLGWTRGRHRGWR